jgi:hypothetical protein
MVDEVTDIDQIAAAPEAAERQWTEEDELEALGGLISAVAEVIPDKEVPTAELNHTPLRRALSHKDKARGWFFEHLINRGIQRHVDLVNQDKPGLCDASPVQDGTYNNIVFRTNKIGELIAYKVIGARTVQLAEYDGIVRIGSKLLVVETKFKQNLPEEFNLEGKVRTLKDAFPDMEVSCLVVLQPASQPLTEVREIKVSSGQGFTLLRRAAGLREQVNAMAGRIHVMASAPLHSAPA